MEDLLPVFIDLKMIKKCPLRPMRQKAGSIRFLQVDEKPHGTTGAPVCDVGPWESG